MAECGVPSRLIVTARRLAAVDQRRLWIPWRFKVFYGDMLMPLLGVLVQKDHAMKYDVVVETAQAEVVAAVRATAAISDIARAWKPALDQVWAFLKTNSELHHGHNLFL